MSTTLRSHMSRRQSAIPKGWPGFMDALRKGAIASTADGKKEYHKQLEGMGAVLVSKAVNQVESSGVAGGYAVPPDFNLSIATTYEENSFWYQRAHVIPMLSRETTLPIIDTTPTGQTAGVAPWFGGMTFGWGTGGTGALVQTNPTLAQVRLTAHSLIGTVVASADLMSDMGPGGDEWFFNTFAKGAAYYEEYAFLNGPGITVGSSSPQDRPQGVISAPGTYTVPRQTPSHIVQQDVSNLAKRMVPLGWTKAIWICSPSALGDITGIAGYVPNQQNGFDTDHVSACGSLLGRPVFVTDKVPSLGTQGDLGFYDPSQYAIGDRAELIVQASDEKLFTTNQIVYRVWRRVDGTPIFSGTITMTNGDVGSAHVVLV